MPDTVRRGNESKEEFETKNEGIDLYIAIAREPRRPEKGSKPNQNMLREKETETKQIALNFKPESEKKKYECAPNACVSVVFVMPIAQDPNFIV